MNEGLKVLNGQSLKKSDSLQTDISKLLWYRIPANLDSTVFSTLISNANFIDYRLGDEIINTLPANSSDFCNQIGNSGDISSLYFVCQGQVRLLCFLSGQVRPITAQLVSAGETFGADNYFINNSSAYRAVAASDVQVAQIPLSALDTLLETCPPLRQQWTKEAQQRERLIFFRTMTSLRSIPAHQLRAWVPYLEETWVEAGTHLYFCQEMFSSEAGRFWLKQGEIETQQGSSQLVEIGTSWGYPGETPADWAARTSLQVYCLPKSAWEISKTLLPELETNFSREYLPAPDKVSPNGNGHAPFSDSKTKDRPAQVPKTELLTSELASSPDDQSQTRVIILPKPVKRLLLDWVHHYPWIEQQSSSDCGAACLSMLARYWGKRFPMHALRERANVGVSGASLKGLATAAESLGFHARPVRASFGRMVDQKNPWIAHWEGNHFVVVYATQTAQVTIADPAMGVRTVSSQEFSHRWTGYALLVEPTDRLRETDIKQKTSLWRYFHALIPYRSLIFQIIVVSFLIQVFGLFSPLFTQIIMDQVVVQKSVSTLNMVAIGMLLFGLWKICMSSARSYLLGYFSNRLNLTLITGFISHTVSLPLNFFESRRVGDILTRVQENSKITRFLIGQIVLAWLNLLTGVVYLGLMLYYNWQLTLLVLGLIPPIVILTLGSTPFLRKISREIFKEAADQNSSLVEMINGIATVKSTATEREVRWLWEDRATRLTNVSFKGRKFSIGLGALNGLINSIGGVVLLWAGAYMVIQDQLTIGQLVAFNMMIGHVISPVLAMANLWDELQEVLISVERLNDVFETAPEESPQHPLLLLSAIQGAVTFEDVTFNYNTDEERNTLQNLDFHTEAGQTIAIVGRSGSGKSTLVKLLEGLYHPNRGRVLVDGHDISHISPQSLRTQLGVVPQECFLFSGTILENITLFRNEFTLEQAVAAAKLAEAHAFIQSMALGYYTKVGEQGSTLSGGQRQRIAIARALLGEPRILILDEATSSLDTESERRFQQNLTQISRDRTTFIIAHRLSTVRNADRILVLDHGVLVEQGTHAELMAAEGLYHHLAQQQLDL
ncbi:ABC transporter transmembrane domain-containing protein [Leptothoe spongobia]|uniref:Peptidase domain-containing ABC transporter n=1 Tax=Leptothoe spongobia TAU-MAC 1115 TaxID=1967444 RepID=A0A947DCA2_9CYAN|nr:peptidase domain-containing ABC transporter [Leptothoe spongobia]MBT9314461.1 peptidase domain-containing ABC transporter [Leptothoe spongobia TAU-MAC 1115]